ncbi:hypothetical protein [Pedobacter endophyticus]|uniref:Uncharacterized protein n=1 Tax=Pedobacter endophyticus TaxID=2789740 RepID=A0A7S9L0B0_9SPHI|nr:hypothetical protein [Pedobacter endophyticus]QPH40157.1 hypothetical protein IZT61_02430 [Pedobacter endophyticus]
MKKNITIIQIFLFILAHHLAKGQDLERLPDQKPITFNGSLTVGTNFYNSWGIANRRQPFFWNITGAPVVTLYGITFPFSFVISEQERRFSQPFNQYGVSPYYKWITVHAGYRNVKFSDYTLAGANFLGGGVELNPKWLRFGFIYGRFSRAVQEDSLAMGSFGYIRPTYKRMGYAAKLGFGSKSKFVDLVFFKAWDDVTSIDSVSSKSKIKPEENIAIGLKSHLAFFKNRLNFDLDIGGSFLTRDTRQASILDSASIPLAKFLDRFATVNASSGFYKAINTSLGYSFGLGNVRGVYKRIDPGYRSLGAYYFQNDMEQFTIAPSLNLWQGKVSVNLSFGGGRDNLNDTRYATTVRKIYSANVNIVATDRLNINLDYGNFGTSQNQGVGDLFNDSTALKVVNANYGAVVSYRISPKSGLSHQFTLSSNYQNTNDLNRFTEAYTNANTFIGSLNYNLSWPSQKINASAGVAYNNTAVYNGKIINVSPNLSLTKMFLNNKLRTTLSESIQFRKSEGQGDGLTSNTSIAAGYTFKRHTVSLNSGYLTNRYKAGIGPYPNFSEFRTNLSYSIRF